MARQPRYLSLKAADVADPKEREYFNAGSVPITSAQFREWVSADLPSEPDANFDVQFKTELTPGAWASVARVTGVAVESICAEDCHACHNGWGSHEWVEVRVYGPRTVSRPRESEYDLVGQASIMGRKRRVFTSSKLFEVVDGPLNQYGKRPLISVGTLYVCKVRGN